jgi:hypothetical protein
MRSVLQGELDEALPLLQIDALSAGLCHQLLLLSPWCIGEEISM